MKSKTGGKNQTPEQAHERSKKSRRTMKYGIPNIKIKDPKLAADLRRIWLERHAPEREQVRIIFREGDD